MLDRLVGYLLTTFVGLCCIAILCLALFLILDVGVGCFSHYETTQGTVLDISWPSHGSGIAVVIGNEAITFHNPDDACALEVGTAYRLKYVTTYHKTRLVSYELLPPLPCPQEATGGN